MIAVTDLLRGIPTAGAAPETVSGLSRDSRTVRPGEAYVAMDPGHLAEAGARGAALLLAATAEATGPAPLLTVPHPRWAFARASVNAHGLDRTCPALLGTTGTKGKSTVTHLAWWMLGGATAGAARVGTIGWHDGVREVANPQTTPPPEQLHAFLAGLPRSCPGVALEVSSHGADQFRLAGLRLRALAVTGIGHDHLDYHGTQEAYISAKLRSVQLLGRGGLLVVNGDDAHAGHFRHAGLLVGARVVLLGAAEVAAAAPPVPLPGAFNAWNAEAAIRLVGELGIPRAVACARLAQLPGIPGRLERLAESPVTYVDYAHTAESLAAVLAAVRTAHPGAPLAVVFGCGGNRDRSKRAPMGAAASTADVVVVTTDNSRDEDPRSIADAVRAGVLHARHGVTCIDEPDRATAIHRARAAVGTDGVVVVAGKGHETTQVVAGRTLPWSDRDFVISLTRPGEGTADHPGNAARRTPHAAPARRDTAP